MCANFFEMFKAKALILTFDFAEESRAKLDWGLIYRHFTEAQGPKD